MAGAIATIAGCLLPAPAGAETLRAADAVARDCAARALPAGSPGVAATTFTAPGSGLLTARLDAAPGSDWDLALLRGGDPVGSSGSFGSIEQASIGVRSGDEVAIQACRRSGGDETADVGLDFFENPAEPLPSSRISLESVSISGSDDVAALERLGFDVTHDVTATTADVVLYNDGQRMLLSTAGYSSTTLIEDLAAQDRADRRAESRAAPGLRANLPSGRTEYRVYDDYANELRELAEENPEFVRPLTNGGGQPGLGLSFEGRPILGIEIAADVNRTDDGRPVYLNFGAHHAREWPAAEFPMEFAHTLVDGMQANDPRIMNLLEDVRIVIVPVVNPDGFIASRSYGTSPADDDENATLGLTVTNSAAYIRKNCRPTGGTPAQVPCAQRVGSGVDLNRNYGAYWGGVGSTTDTTSQGYRGTGPFSEPETEALHQYQSTIHPTVYITNHTYTAEGEWLRQPGFKLSTLPDDNPNPSVFDPFTEDEVALKELGDSWASATGWESNRSYAIGEITGAAEDWNYFAQGTYGYTPEGRGPNFHASYATAVVNEYKGDATHVDQGVEEAFLLGGERAAMAADHSIVQGNAPPGVTLRLRKQFNTPTSNPAGGPATVAEDLNTTLQVGASGQYTWNVNPSLRPDVDSNPLTRTPAAESWTMTCERPGQGPFPPVQVTVARGATETVNWATTCGTDPPVNTPPVADFDVFPTAPEAGQQINLTSTSTDSDGAIEMTEWDLDGDGTADFGPPADAEGIVATVTFPTPGTYPVRVKVTDDDADSHVETKNVVVSAAANLPPVASFGFDPDPPAPGDNTTFTSTSADPDGNLISFDWDFDDDGQFDDAAGSVITRSFPAAGSYPVSLRVTDDDNATAASTRTVEVRRPAGSGGQPQAVRRTCFGQPATIVGTGGRDVIRGTRGPDVIAALGGADRVRAAGGNDIVCGGRGRDRLRGGRGIDALFGGGGRDRLVGGGGPDRCRGGRGHDLLRSCA